MMSYDERREWLIRQQQGMRALSPEELAERQAQQMKGMQTASAFAEWGTVGAGLGNMIPWQQLERQKVCFQLYRWGQPYARWSHDAEEIWREMKGPRWWLKLVGWNVRRTDH